MVENQWGSSDMIQSMNAKVVTNVNTTNPGALIATHFLDQAADRRCDPARADQLLSRYA